MKDEPRKNKVDVKVDPANNQEDVGKEPKEVCSETSCQGRVGVMERQVVRDASDDGGCEENEDEDSGHAKEEVHNAEEGSKNLEQSSWVRSHFSFDLHIKFKQ